MFFGGRLRNDKREELAGEFLLSIERLMKGTGVIFRAVLEDYDVTHAQFHLLMVVKGRGKTTVTEISRLLMIAPPTASRMIAVSYTHLRAHETRHELVCRLLL